MMNKIDISAIDLNLLKTLDALLAEGSVTAAAKRLGVGQPAASHALARLRELFGDPLLVRMGRNMAPTPRAEALRAPLRRFLQDAARLIQYDTEFDPAATDRAFVLLCPDLLAPMLPRIVARLRSAAPHASLHVRERSRDDTNALEEGRVDLMLTHASIDRPGLVHEELGVLNLRVLARRDHPGLTRRRSLSAKAWAAYPHIQVRTGHGGHSVVGGALTQLAFERRVALTVPSFLTALVTLSRTDFFFTVPGELVAPLIEPLELRALLPPLDLPEIKAAAVSHERFANDQAHRFFRGLVVDEIRDAIRQAHRTR